jgi:hypothetical protein
MWWKKKGDSPAMLNQTERFERSGLKNELSQMPQQLSFFSQPENKAVSARPRVVKRPGERYLQACLWKESLLAVQVSLQCHSVAELVVRLREHLPQNSLVTRERNTSTILSRFFPTNEIDQLPRRVLYAYDDAALLAAVMRVLFLEAEPLVGRLVTEHVFPLPPGTALAQDFFTRYAQEVVGKKVKDIASRCSTALHALGWIVKEKRKFYVAQQTVNETAALLLFHHYYASTPRIIDMNFLLAESVWKYLGFANEDAVRGIMRKLEHRGLIARYAVVDRLEQVTTRYSLASFIERKVRV